jgi:hypothetical protein
MASRRSKGTPDSEPRRRATLTVPRVDAEARLALQMKAGEALIARPPILTGEALQELENDAKSWTEYTEGLLETLFDSPEYSKEFAQIVGRAYYGGMPPSELWADEQKEIAERVRRLRSIAARLPLVPEPGSSSQALKPIVAADSRRVFVVHGHDEGVQQSVARFLEKLDLIPVILHEQPNRGRTVIEKFEAYSDVRFAVVLLTPDDVGGSASASGEMNPRARQNVILELGYFIGKLGRARVCPLYVEGIDLPSDIHGIVYVPYDSSGGWRVKLASEIRAAGIEVDLNQAV